MKQELVQIALLSNQLSGRIPDAVAVPRKLEDVYFGSNKVHPKGVVQQLKGSRDCFPEGSEKGSQKASCSGFWREEGF